MVIEQLLGISLTELDWKIVLLALEESEDITIRNKIKRQLTRKKFEEIAKSYEEKGENSWFRNSLKCSKEQKSQIDSSTESAKQASTMTGLTDLKNFLEKLEASSSKKN